MRSVILAAGLGLLVPATGAPSTVWGPEQNLSLTSTDSETGLNHRPMAMTPDGTLHVVWAESDSPNLDYRIWTRRLLPSGWSPPELIVDYLGSDPPGGAKYPALAAHPDGSLDLFWHDYRVASVDNIEIFTKRRAPGGSWDPSRAADVRLTTTSHPESNGDNGYVPVPVTAGDGTTHVLWYDFRFDGSRAEILAKTRPSPGAWDVSPGDSADVRVTSDPEHSELVAVDVDSEGCVHAAWRSALGGAVAMYAGRDPSSGAWAAPLPVSTTSTLAGAPALCVDIAGRVHVVWPDSREGSRALWTRVREPSGAWGAETRLTPPGHAADEPSLTVAPDGSIHLVWHDGRHSLLTPEVFHREKAPAAAWDTTSALDVQVSASGSSALRPSVLATSDQIFVLWKDTRDGNHELYFRRRGTGATAAGAFPTRTGGMLLVAPNPARGGVVRLARADGSPAGPLDVVDAAGRRVRRLGPGARAWDGRSAHGRAVPTGVYFFRDRHGTAARVTVIR